MTRSNTTLMTAIGLAVALASPGNAASFDSQKCKQFISGTWTSKPGGGAQERRTTYDVGGTYQQGDETQAASGTKDTGESGSWDAQPNKSGDGCKLQLTPTGGKARNFAISIVDEDTIKADDGTVSNRLKGQMEPASPP